MIVFIHPLRCKLLNFVNQKQSIFVIHQLPSTIHTPITLTIKGDKHSTFDNAGLCGLQHLL